MHVSLETCRPFVLAAATAVAAGCGSSSATERGSPDGGQHDARAVTTPPVDAGHDHHAAADAGHDQHAAADASRDAPGARDTGTTGDGGQDAGSPSALADPNAPGPYTYKEIDDSMNVAATGDTGVAIHCGFPTAGPTKGPYPVVVFAHGMSLAASEYYGYVQRLASFGYVAMTVDYPASPLSSNNPNDAQDLVAGLDWAKASATVGAIANTDLAGMSGHSLGGKLALLAATMDSRVKASITFDPVDSGSPLGCSPPSCVTVAPLMANLHIPTGVLGELWDATNGFLGQDCAPAGANFVTFYSDMNSPSFEVTVNGAEHMSFLDDMSSCGVACTAAQCSDPPDAASNAEVVGMAHAYIAAFYERWLRGNKGYDTYLTGAMAQSRYVSTGEASIVSK